MLNLAEKTRKTLERLVKNLKTQESVSSVSLFGSQSRGDAAASSDVDLLIIDNREFDYEYVERTEQNGLLIDLNHVPQKWITKTVPPEIDQKIFESYVLYDRDWTLSNVKEQITKSYYTPERLGIRADVYLIDADIFLSRATSAQAREDYESAKAFAVMSAQSILKTIIEACKLPVSNSRYVETLKKATEQLDVPWHFTSYQTIAGLDNLSQAVVEARLNGFKTVWDEIATSVRTNKPSMDSLHFKIRTKLDYYVTPAFLQGVILRSQALLNEGALPEAAHYVFSVLVDMLENYAWLEAYRQNVRLDYSTLFRSLKGLTQKPSPIHRNAVAALGLANVDAGKVEKIVALTRQIVLDVRTRRKALFNLRRQETY
ncbi:MAG: nucleotidyltransferase domain-containing protein [Candidatus Bathyarchaeia archaeon]|jgi:predicted nucleotidyltransferase|nr:nucleotidyltransferase domain-containing protein [Candidatus Bathyarchaeota archaeon A05DMB-4]MDH7595104.1 nucleotidyltransferase domain-containing protein [Candidatus Bathyarchaeota archaeon]